VIFSNTSEGAAQICRKLFTEPEKILKKEFKNINWSRDLSPVLLLPR